VQKTVKSVDPSATVDIDIASKRVKITSDTERATFADALVAAGYSPAGPW
jgi:copper chaperone